MSLTKLSENKVAGGWHQRFSHISAVNNCEMTFAIFLPPQAAQGQKVPVLYWLSGLTCTDENFMQKAGAFKKAAELGICIVAPDTSPRGKEVADDKDGAYDFGLGAGFYLNATQAPFAQHYQMYSYITQELPKLIEAEFAVSDKKSISGHSMGGHGALTIGLKNRQSYRSISAFSPITNPIQVPWGQKAFSGYLGADKTTWAEYDSCELLKQASSIQPIMIEQGLADQFLQNQLTPQALLDVAAEKGFELNYTAHQDYDHSYFFISSFIDKHLAFHAEYLV
ncbi:S-formylglutathione hydrolase [Catenovulum agarivorans]|uniref:S-formylglutathione hydrolase n=1 Tax=Catenovulum agarivorans TaxID=1172192 RepID=UPI0002EA53D8|nr:S-formylglutathione hydrolase [Catenovulum agarivorans]